MFFLIISVNFSQFSCNLKNTRAAIARVPIKAFNYFVLTFITALLVTFPAASLTSI